jgi:hypothetical protein
LIRIKSGAFAGSALRSIEIPQKVQFLEGSAFSNTALNSTSIKTSPERFVIENDILFDVIDQRLIRSFSSSSHITIVANIEIIGSHCFHCCKSLSSISFESNSRLSRIESEAFSISSLQSIEIPRNVEVLGSSCFNGCGSLSSVSFESNSRLIRIESSAFSLAERHSNAIESKIAIPSTVLFIDSDAAPDPFQFTLADGGSCKEFDRWQRLHGLGLVVDFRRIRKLGSGFPSFSDCLFDVSGFREVAELSEEEGISTRLYHACGEEIEIVVKSTSRAICVENCALEKALEELMNLRHPCIAGPIGIVHSSSLQGLKIVRVYAGGYSLSTVVSVLPEWWTPTVKAKTVAGILLGLRYAHSFGLLHGHLTTNNIILDGTGMVQITDFCVRGLGCVEGNEWIHEDVGGFSGENWTVKEDVRGFARILSAIVASSSAGESEHSPWIPSFVPEIIEIGLSSSERAIESLQTIFLDLKHKRFEILEGVDSDEVSQFVNWVATSEQLTE